MDDVTAPSIEVCGLCKDYRGFSLRDVSFSLDRGYLMGLVGPNGAGKTTILKALLGLVRPSEGTVRLFGADVAAGGAALRQRVGFVLEAQPFHGHLSVAGTRSIVAPHYDRWDDARFRELCGAFELRPRARVGTLSKGARTRLALALALAHHAELLVLDEPTAGLDPAARRRVVELLQGLIADGRTSVLLSTHLTSDLELASDFVTLIRRGRVLLSATREELRDRYAVVKGPPEAAALASGATFHGMRRGEFGFRVLTSEADAARRILGGSAVVEPATLEEIMDHLGKEYP